MLTHPIGKRNFHNLTKADADGFRRRRVGEVHTDPQESTPLAAIVVQSWPLARLRSGDTLVVWWSRSTISSASMGRCLSASPQSLYWRTTSMGADYRLRSVFI